MYLCVVEIQPLGSLALLAEGDAVPAGHHHLHVLKAVAPEVGLAVEYLPVHGDFIWLLVKNFLKLSLRNFVML